MKVRFIRIGYAHTPRRGKRVFSADVEINGRPHYFETRADNAIEAWQVICERIRRDFKIDFDKAPITCNPESGSPGPSGLDKNLTETAHKELNGKRTCRPIECKIRPISEGYETGRRHCGQRRMPRPMPSEFAELEMKTIDDPDDAAAHVTWLVPRALGKITTSERSSGD
jgi:hypothetical protein